MDKAADLLPALFSGDAAIECGEDVAVEPEPRQHPEPEAFSNRQLSLFQDVLCNTDEERRRLSNAIELWDSIPRYSVSRLAMSRLRINDKYLPDHEATFQHEGRTYAITISPASIVDVDRQKREYYPSATEELVEEALRKMALQQQQGFFDKHTFRSGVVFTIYALREELAKLGHSRSHKEIVLALKILSKSVIEIRDTTGKGEVLASSAYLPALIAVSKRQLAEDPTAKWAAQFHPFVTESIDRITYRQFNYHRLMSHDGRLTRWLHKYLVLKFVFADVTKTFRLNYSTVKRDSGLLNEYARERDAMDALQRALNDLQEKEILSKVERITQTGPKNKILDIRFTLWPSFEFVKEVKAANKRQLDAQRKILA